MTPYSDVIVGPGISFLSGHCDFLDQPVVDVYFYVGSVNYGFEVIPGASLCRKVDPGTAFWSRACDVHVRIRPKKIPPCLRHWTDSNKIGGKEKHWNIAGTLGLYCLRQGLTIMNNYRDLKRPIVYYVPELGKGGGGAGSEGGSIF